MLQKARDLSGAGTWFLTVRVAEVGLLVLLVGAYLDARSAWQVGSQYIGDASTLGTDGTPDVSLMQRIIGMALYGGYRGPISVLVVGVALGGLLVVLHRCQPVSHTRVLRWEWLTLWAATALLALTASAVGVIALFGDDPFASSEPGVITGSTGPGFHEQVVSSLSWPLGALMLLLPLGLWWARLPDMDDLEDALASLDAEGPDGRILEAATSPGAPEPAAPSVAGAIRSGRFRRATGTRSQGRGRDGDGDQDAIFIDDVEQIEPAERLQARADERGDGSSASGYDGYFRRQ